MAWSLSHLSRFRDRLKALIVRMSLDHCHDLLLILAQSIQPRRKVDLSNLLWRIALFHVYFLPCFTLSRYTLSHLVLTLEALIYLIILLELPHGGLRLPVGIP